MSLSIRQRGQKVAECIYIKGSQGLQAIANATGLTISSGGLNRSGNATSWSVMVPPL